MISSLRTRSFRAVGIRGTALVVLVPLLLLAGCKDQTKDPAAAVPSPVRVAVASAVAWPEVVRVPATVSAVDVAPLASRAGGWVTEVNVSAGEHVARGEVLITVGLPEARSRLASAEARVKATEAALEEASANRRRYGALVRTHATSALQYDSAERSFITAEAETAAAKAALAAARNNLGYAEIRAPFAGMIVEKNVQRGAFAAPGKPLLTIAGSAPEVRAFVGPATVRALKVGEAATVSIGGESRPATITRIVDAADPETRTHLIELHLPPGVSAPFGAYAEVCLTLGHRQQLAVPEAALTERAGLRGVFVVDAQHHAHFRLVRTGQSNAGRVAVAAGLEQGESVVLAPSAALFNDSPVRPEGKLSASLPAQALHD